MRRFTGVVCLVIMLSAGGVWAQSHAPQEKGSADLSVRSLEITGEIAQMGEGYIIRGQTPSEIFTILNPKPDLLGKYLKEGKMVQVGVRVVSGDNVEILSIDGKEY